MAMNLDNSGVEHIAVPFQGYIKIYSDIIGSFRASENPIYRAAAEQLSAMIANKKHNEHFWFLVRKHVMAHDADSGKRLNDSNDEKYKMHIRLRALKDASEEYDLEQKVKVDPLTGMRNRLGFAEDFAECIAQASGKIVVSVFIDMDKLKQANDLLTHDGADEVIIELGARLKKAVDATGLSGDAYRFGGDEMGVLLSINPSDREKILGILTDILNAAAAEPFFVNGTKWQQTLSCGAVVVEDHKIDSQKALMRTADELQILAKITTHEELRNKPDEISPSLLKAMGQNKEVARGNSTWALASVQYEDEKLDDVTEKNFIFGAPPAAPIQA